MDTGSESRGECSSIAQLSRLVTFRGRVLTIFEISDNICLTLTLEYRGKETGAPGREFGAFCRRGPGAGCAEAE